MNHHSHKADAGRIHDDSLAHSMANAVDAEKEAKLLKNPDQTNLEDIALTAGVVELIGDPQKLADFANEHLNIDANSSEIRDEKTYAKLSAEAVAHIAAKIAMTQGVRVQTKLSMDAGIPQATLSRVATGMWLDNYLDKNNAARLTDTSRSGQHLTPTKDFARELAQNRTWQRAIMIQKLALRLGTTEDLAMDYALEHALQEKEA